MSFWSFPPTSGQESPWPVLQRVLTYPELDLQRGLIEDHEVAFAFVMREDPDDWTRGGKRILGTAQMPGVTGALSGLFDQMLSDVLGFTPDFMIVLNRTFWEEASDIEREILVFHEMKHCGQAIDEFGLPKFNKRTGRPILAMVSHDVEEFNDVVRRYGAWKSDLVTFRAAFNERPPTGQDAKPLDLEAALASLRDTLVESGITMSVELDRGGTPHRESPDDVF